MGILCIVPFSRGLTPPFEDGDGGAPAAEEPKAEEAAPPTDALSNPEGAEFCRWMGIVVVECLCSVSRGGFRLNVRASTDKAGRRKVCARQK